ncbi:MAG: hypothetical protein ACEQSO_08365, partial [Aquirufa sp.]
YKGTNAIFIGDRIAPQNTKITDQIIDVNYADREDGDAMTVKPSVGKTLHVKFEEGKLVAIENK